MNMFSHITQMFPFGGWFQVAKWLWLNGPHYNDKYLIEEDDFYIFFKSFLDEYQHNNNLTDDELSKKLTIL